MTKRLIAALAGNGCVPVPCTSARRLGFKRVTDIAVSLAMLVVAAPVMLVAALLIRLTSKGPALYRQMRVGAGGQEFCLYKLRTMIDGAERETGPVMALRCDPRVTGIGRVLRAMRIDEFPQLINVLRGEMSLVGPRPERPHFVDIYRRGVPGYELRHAVRPGITGLAQIRGGYWSSAENKLRFDIAYIHRASLVLDMEILFRTGLTLLRLAIDNRRLWHGNLCR